MEGNGFLHKPACRACRAVTFPSPIQQAKSCLHSIKSFSLNTLLSHNATLNSTQPVSSTTAGAPGGSVSRRNSPPPQILPHPLPCRPASGGAGLHLLESFHSLQGLCSTFPAGSLHTCKLLPKACDAASPLLGRRGQRTRAVCIPGFRAARSQWPRS